jgi:hypothetical protein
MTPDPLDIPFLPLVGDVYRVRTIIVQPPDKHDTRPYVVVASPANMRGRISLVCRTSDTSADGIGHERDRRLSLTKDGVFNRLRSTEAQLWTPRNVTRLGPLERYLVDRIIERFWA